MSIVNIIGSRTDPLVKITVTLSQYVKITKTSQALGTFQLLVVPGSDGIVLNFQNPPSNPILSVPLNSKFVYQVQEKKQWSLTVGVKQWIVDFVDEKDMAKALCAVALALEFKDQGSVIKYDPPGQEKAGKEVSTNDKVQITYYVYNFSEFPFINKLVLSKVDVKTNLTSQHMAAGFVQGICGMTKDMSRIIFVPAALAAADKKDQPNPVEDLMFYVTLKHAKYSSEAPDEPEPEPEPSETHEEETNNIETIPKMSPFQVGSLNKPASSPPKSVEIPPPSTTIPPPDKEEKKEEVNEKSDILSKVRKISMGMPMMAMGMSYTEMKRQQKLEERHEQEEQRRMEEENMNREVEKKETNTHNDEEKEIPIDVPKRRPSNVTFKQATEQPKNPIHQQPIAQPITPAQPIVTNSASSKPSSVKRGLFDEPNPTTSNSDLLQRLDNLEKTIDRKLSLVCGTNAELVDPDSIIRGISALAVQLKMKTAEYETIKKQHAQAKVKSSGAAASERQLETARSELAEQRRIKSDLESSLRQSDLKVKEAEKKTMEYSDIARKNGNNFVKSMMSKVFEDMNASFNEKGSYSGSEVSNVLYDLLRKHAFATMNEISEKGLF